MRLSLSKPRDRVLAAATTKCLGDLFYQNEIEIAKITSTRQPAHGVIFSWVKLREEVRL